MLVIPSALSLLVVSGCSLLVAGCWWLVLMFASTFVFLSIRSECAKYFLTEHHVKVELEPPELESELESYSEYEQEDTKINLLCRPISQD